MSHKSAIHILMVEDDRKLSSLTGKYLEQHGLKVTIESNGVRGLKVALEADFDVVLLDIMLPEMDGIEICRKLRHEKDVPIIMLTARGEEADRVLGLEIGADDYMAKPFSPRELLARIRSQVRRTRGDFNSKKQTTKVGALTIDLGLQQAFLNGENINLTSHEYILLTTLADNLGRVLSRDTLMEITTGSMCDAFDRSIDVHISRLRRKLGDDPRQPQIIKTVRNAGYLMLSKQLT